MNNGLLAAKPKRTSSSSLRRGQVIARARSTAAISGVSATGAATGTDVTGAAITFTLLDGETAEVEGKFGFVYNSAANVSAGCAITDAANAEKVAEWFTSATASATGMVVVSEEIVGPGVFTRKLVLYKAAGTGTSACGIDARFVHQIKATIT